MLSKLLMWEKRREHKVDEKEENDLHADTDKDISAAGANLQANGVGLDFV